MSNLPKGMKWRGFSGVGTAGWYLVTTGPGSHYVLGIFKYSREKDVCMILYRNNRKDEEIRFDYPVLTEALRDELLPIGLMNRIDI